MEGILDWWLKYMPAPDGRLFYGAVDIHNQPVPHAEIGIVMVSRILWTFSSAYLSNPDPRYAEMADRAYRLIRNSFVDPRYGGVYWSLEAAKSFEGKVEILDLRSLNPLDHEAMNDLCQRHGKIIIVTEESIECSFSLGLAGRLQRDNFHYLDAPIKIVGSKDTPAIPLNSTLEASLLTNAQLVSEELNRSLNF